MPKNKKLRYAIYSVMAAGIVALVCLYLSGISLITMLVGAKTVELREDMSKSAMQTLTGEYLGAYMATEDGTYGMVQCSDGAITVLTDRELVVGEEVTVEGFVVVLDDSERENLYAWYDENGDFSGGEAYFDNVSPMMIHDNYGRIFDTATSKALTGFTLVCGIYMIIVYMGVSSGKYGEDK